jgi:hypothetical protein
VEMTEGQIQGLLGLRTSVFESKSSYSKIWFSIILLHNFTLITDTGLEFTFLCTNFVRLWSQHYPGFPHLLFLCNWDLN